MYEEGVLKCRYRKGKLIKRYQSDNGEEGEERKYEEVYIKGKRKHEENKNGDKENQRIFGDDNDENEKALLIDEEK